MRPPRPWPRNWTGWRSGCWVGAAQQKPNRCSEPGPVARALFQPQLEFVENAVIIDVCMADRCENEIRRAWELFGKVRDAERSHAEQLLGQVAVWGLIRDHFVRPGYSPQLVLLNVDPWPKRPPIQPWLESHFAGLWKRTRNRITLDIRVLDQPNAMDLLTNVMRFIPISANGQASNQLPLLQDVVLQLEAVEPAALVAFLEPFTHGNTWGRALGSLPSEFRAGFKRFVEAERGRVLVHPYMGLENHVSVYASPDKTLAPVMGHLAALLQTWRDNIRR